MKHYPHHIGDFDKKTRHLSRLERSVYRDMLDVYYDTEQMLPLDIDMVCRKVLARSNEERTAVEQVLNEFFIKTEDGWYNDRCDQVIEAYWSNTSQKSQAGKASAAARADKKQRMLNGRSTGVQREGNGDSTNQKPETRNQKPVIKDKATATRLPTDWVPPPEYLSYCRQERKDLDPVKTAESFKDYWISKPGAGGRKLDWAATWRNWVRSQRQAPNGSGHYSDERKDTYNALTGQGLRNEPIDITPTVLALTDG